VDELVDVGCAVGAGFIYDAAGAEVQDCVHSDVPFDSFFVADIGARSVTEGTHVTIETNLDNDAVSTCLRVGTRRAASRSPCDGRRCGRTRVLDRSVSGDGWCGHAQHAGGAGSKPDVSTSTTTKSLAAFILQHCCLHRQDCGCCWRTVVLRTYGKALDVGGQDAARLVAVRPDLAAQSIVIKSLPAGCRIFLCPVS